MKEELQRILTNQLKTFKAEDEAAEEAAKKENKEFIPKHGGINIKEVLIADIVFAFDNAEMINLLKTRGGHIMFNRYDESRKVEEEIIKLKDEKWKKLIRPVDAFITFQQEDGMIVADSYEHMEKALIPEFLGQTLEFIESTEPTNIIWENRHYDDTHYFKQGLKVLILVACLLAVSFITIYFFKSDAIAQARKYPSIKADDVIRQYEEPAGNDTDNSKMYLLYEHAKSEYEYLLQAEKEEKKPNLNGLY